VAEQVGQVRFTYGKEKGDYLMSRYVIMNNTTNVVEQIVCWANVTPFPTDWILNPTDKVMVILDDTVIIDLDDIYNPIANTFHNIDITDAQMQISVLQYNLNMSSLTDIQEATWNAMGLDVTKLPQAMQDLLNQKIAWRAELATLQA
jgi:hypothetical protein